MKANILAQLDFLLSLQHDYNTLEINLIKKIIKDLEEEWSNSEYYAQQIRQILDIDNTYDNLNNIKIR